MALALTKERPMKRSVPLITLLVLLASSVAPSRSLFVQAGSPSAGPRSAALPPGYQRVAPAGSPTAPHPQTTPTDISCVTSPFGGILTLLSENEAFVGYRGGSGSATNGWLQNTMFDRNGTSPFQPQFDVLGGNSAARYTNTAGTAATTPGSYGDVKAEYIQDV